MNLEEKKSIKVAILDLYEGVPNQGMRCIREILHQYADANHLNLQCDEFEVRQKLEVPDVSVYDIYISSGGPGSPLDSEGTEWEEQYFGWLSSLERWNNNPLQQQKKFAFFICHSFQLICRHYRLATVSKRKSTSFGVFPMHLLEAGLNEYIFEGLNDPFYAVDSRDYQVISPNYTQFAALGSSILCIEKERPHIPLERAVMAVRFNEYMIGTQFHPEADAISMRDHLLKDINKARVIEEHGEAKYWDMLDKLDDPDKILLTQKIILPAFLDQALEKKTVASTV